MTKVVIYTGPSLSHDEATAILPTADIRPPIRRGDLLKAFVEESKLIGIIDGELYSAPTVSPKEIINTLAAGVVVLGGAGIGSLRATELYPYGMIGIGTIFNWYRTEKLHADDAVFSKYDPVTFQRLSDPLVNMIYTFSVAEHESIISSSQRDLLVDIAQGNYFSRRTYSRILAEAEPSIGSGSLKKLHEFIDRRGVDLQKRDAICLLQAAIYYENGSISTLG